KIIRRFQPLADYLAANLGEFGITTGEVRVAPDFETAVSWLRDGEIDLYFDSLYPAMIMQDQAGAQPILRRWKDGVSEYHSVFFVLENSDIDSLEDLQGNIVVFDEPFSTSGYMVPFVHLIEAGLNPEEVDSISATVEDDAIGYVFSGDDDNIIQWVISGRAAAGVSDSESYASIPEETRDQIVILAETEPIPRHVGLVRPGMDSALIEAITATLLAMSENPDAQSVLEQFETSQFDEFPEGLSVALDNMRAMYAMVQDRQTP
ncbi:MAG: phosphate/phosphite/phosphonate ABC transporter substrate-binding protein, partial [Burkholderiales bacterium]|nr:phosphate/phosphite/phosphonate ABC transporter substrate-binding protein [Anaerolineae bacterium]